METLFKDGFGFVKFKFSLEVLEVVGIAAAIGTTSCVREVEVLVDYLLAYATPKRTVSGLGCDFV
jgi:hypothetical protein